MTDEQISVAMGWHHGFVANLGRDDFAARVRTVVAAAESAEREAADVTIKALRDTLGGIAMRMAKDAAYRHRVAEELLELALWGPNV